MDRREQIRRAAVEVIAEKGFYEATTQMIADEAGISVGTIYNYFRTKEEILGYIFKVECNRRISFLETLTEEEKSVKEKLRAFFSLHFQEIRRSPSLSKLMLQEFKFSVRDEFKPVKDLVFQIPQLLAQIINTEERNHDKAQILGTVILGAIQALTTRFLFQEDDITDSDLNIIVEDLVNLFSR